MDPGPGLDEDGSQVGLVAFDFDGTLSESVVLDLLGERAGVGDEMRALTERAVRGEADYSATLRRRVRLLEGLPAADVDAAYDRVALRPGAADLLAALADAGVTTAIVTNGFGRGVRAVLDAADATVDRVVANRLHVEDGLVRGEVSGPLVEVGKDEALVDLADRAGVDLAATAAVGDGANDVPMLDRAGVAVGLDPEPAVRPHCDVVVADLAGLRDLFESLGVLG